MQLYELCRFSTFDPKNLYKEFLFLFFILKFIVDCGDSPLPSHESPCKHSGAFSVFDKFYLESNLWVKHVELHAAWKYGSSKHVCSTSSRRCIQRMLVWLQVTKAISVNEARGASMVCRHLKHTLHVSAYHAASCIYNKMTSATTSSLNMQIDDVIGRGYPVSSPC